MQMPHKGSFRLGLFADGPVGRAVVQHVWANRPQDLKLLVVNSAEFAKSTGLDPSRASELQVISWGELLTSSGIRRARSQRVDVVVLCWWPHVLKRSQLELAGRHTLNMHPSLLPHCRGKDPNFWCLVEQRPFGVTIHHVDVSVDGGDIAFQKSIRVSWQDTGETLYRKAEAALVQLFQDSYASIAANAVPRIKQDLPRGSYHRREELDPASHLDLDAKRPVRDLLNLLRARTFPPHPSCRFEDAGETYEVRIEITKKT
jgi:methionyl-tRNA formyltransferase